MDLTDYPQRLAELILDPANGLLLDAEELMARRRRVREAGPDGPRAHGAMFERTSSTFTQRYVTLWKLYEMQGMFEECVDALADHARRLRQATGFSTMVTCTPTAKHLMDHLHASIETAADSISVQYLGQYPVLDPGTAQPLDFHDRKVLLVTDVVASGTLLQHLAQIVVDLGGTPVAALAPVIIDPHHLASLELADVGQLSTRDRSVVNWDPASCTALVNVSVPPARRAAADAALEAPAEPLRLTVLTPIVLNEGVEVRRRPPSPELLIRIDPSTVLPQAESRNRAAAPWLFSPEELVRHAEQARALDFSVYRADNRHFTTAFRFDRLLGEAERAREIWARIKPRLATDTVLVTTFGREDVRFKDFIQRHLLVDTGRAVPTVFVPRRELLGSPGDYFLLDGSAEALRNKQVTLVLGSAHTSDKLRELAALLAAETVEKITVVCLLNRMGRQTEDFLARVRKLIHRLPPPGRAEEPESPAAEFEFHAVYSILDLREADIARMLSDPLALLNLYEGATRVHFFQQLARNLRKYYEPQCVTSRQFVAGGSEPRRCAPFKHQLDERPESEVTVHLEDSKLFVLCHYLAATRDYRPIINELVQFDNRATIQKLLALLLADMSYLRTSGQAQDVRAAILRHIRAIRAERPTEPVAVGWNTSQKASYRDAFGIGTRTEAPWWVALAMLSYLDQGSEYEAVVNEVLLGGRSQPEDWREHPISFVSYYQDERIVWSVSLMLIFACPRFGDSLTAVALKRRLSAQVTGLARLARQLLRQYEAELAKPNNSKIKRQWLDTELQRLNDVRNHLDFLLVELGEHSQTEWHEVIRFLHRHVTRPKEQHNPISTHLRTVTQALQDVIRQAGDVNPFARINFPDPTVSDENEELCRRVKQSLVEAQYSASLVAGVAASARRMFFFTKTASGDLSRFTNAPTLPGLARDADRLCELFAQARRDNKIADHERREVTQLCLAIREDLWGSESALRRALEAYLPDLKPLLLDAIKHAKTFLSGTFVSGAAVVEEFWADQQKRIQQEFRADLHVLCDRYVLTEVLRNIFSNVRHGLVVDQAGGEPQLDVRLEWRIEDDSAVDRIDPEPVRYLYLTVESPATTESIREHQSLASTTTIVQQSRDLANFAAELKAEPLYRGGRPRFLSVLKLLLREPLRPV